jgi:hypothetical protein
MSEPTDSIGGLLGTFEDIKYWWKERQRKHDYYESIDPENKGLPGYQEPPAKRNKLEELEQPQRDNNSITTPSSAFGVDESAHDPPPQSKFVLPGHRYIGPGNPLNNGQPVDSDDAIAKTHDIAYNNAETAEDVRAADRKAIGEFAHDAYHNLNPHSALGAAGLGVKYGVESLTGVIYPSISGMPSVHSKTDNRYSPYAGSSQSEQAAPASSGAEPAVDPAAVPQDIEMANLTGTGKEQASGGASSDGLMVYTIERPISIFGTKTSTYKKVHKFMTFGFTSSGIVENATPQDIFMSSYLAEIPWHIPALYLNQSEFDLLPPSSKVKMIAIEVVYRGSTIQFETNAAATGLATLNQINDIGVAHALNRTGWGSNVRYTAFNANQPMIPTGVAPPMYGPIAGTYRGMVRDYYGSNNNTADFQGDIPKHQVARQTFLYNYWALSARGNVAAGPNSQFGGWPCLAEKFKQMDGKTVVNQVVASSMYEPKMAPIKSTLRTIGHGLPFPTQNNTISVPGLGNMVNQRQANITIPNVIPSTSGIQASTTEVSYSVGNVTTTEPTFSIYTPIEKSQYASSGYWNTPQGHIQPSIHVGVQPVPALSSAALLLENGQFNQWTDTRAYWEVTATMVVEESTPTAYPYAAVPNVPLGENVNWAPAANRPVALTDPSQDGATVCGLYTLSAAPLT